MLENHPISPKDHARIHRFGKKVSPRIFLGCELIAGWIWKGDILKADLEDVEKLDASNIYLRKINAKEVLIRQMISNSNRRLYSKTVRKRTHCKAGTDREERGSQWRTSRRIGKVSTDRTTRWRWCLCRPITVNLEFNSTCWRKKHPCSTEIHWFYKACSYWSGCVTWEKRIDDCWHVDSSKHVSGSWRGFTQITHLRRSLQKDTCGLVETDKDPNNNQTRSCMDWRFGRKL